MESSRIVEGTDQVRARPNPLDGVRECPGSNDADAHMDYGFTVAFCAATISAPRAGEQ